jgi:hypothetical protein
MRKLFWAGGLIAVVALVAACKQGVDVKNGGRAKGKIYTVDNSGDAGQYVAMDIDGHDAVHMVYYDKKNQALKYVRQSPSGFAIDTVDDGCGKCLYCTIKVTGAGEPHVVYYRDANKTLTYAYRKEGAWKKEPIEWGDGTGMGARLLFDREWKLHVLYYSGDGHLKHAWRVLREEGAKPSLPPKPKKPKKGKEGEKVEVVEPTEGIWGKERVDQVNGSEKVQISFVLQPKSGLAASYFHWSGLNSEVRVAIQGEGGKWSTEVVATENNPGKSSALFFTPRSEPRIIFREARLDRLCIAEFTSEGWAVKPLLNGVYNMALASDASGKLLIAYEKMSGPDPRKGHLNVAIRKSGVWTNYEVDGLKGAGTHLDAVSTSSGASVIVYYEERGHSLKLFVGE